MAGFLKRIFSFGKHREEAEKDAASEEVAEAVDTAPVETHAPEPDPEPEPEQVEPVEEIAGAPEPLPPIEETAATLEAPAPSAPAGGTVLAHAEADAVALEAGDEPPTESAAGPDTEAYVATIEDDASAEGNSDAPATPEIAEAAEEISEPTSEGDTPDNAPEPAGKEAPPEASEELSADEPSLEERPADEPPAGDPVAVSPPPIPAERPRRFSSAPDTSAATEPPPEPATKRGFFSRLREGLGRSSRELTQQITGVFTKRKLDDDTLQDLEDVLIRADLGVETAMRITETLADTRYGKEVGADEVRAIMAGEVRRVLEPVAVPLELDLEKRPHVILVVGVNGTGKTTTIGKLAAKLRASGLSVMLAAGDTFRAAAIEQLHIWGSRVGAEVVSTKLGADAAGLAFEAYEKAKAAGVDVLLVDTAGRLQNKTELMDELAKVVRVLRKHDPDAPHTVLQTLDATTGQNALAQVEIFRERAGVGGLVMTKLDGTARGGILVAIAAKHKLPVWFIGVGEGVDDLEPFKADEFARAIVGDEAVEPA